MIGKSKKRSVQEGELRLLPLMIDMSKRKVVIFGGGKVGERKAALFFRYAPTSVISHDFTPQLKDLSEQGLRLIKTKGTMSDDEIVNYINGAFMVIPTTNDLEFNNRIAEMAHQMGCLVDSVDSLDDVAVPSIIERGVITISISTGGASPALSKYIRKKIETVITPESDAMAQLQKDIRGRLKATVPEQKDRSRILWAILEDEDVWSALNLSYENAMDIALKHISNGNN
ncbi:MAG: bifunctional precorrin-2 dehydrogenase/sirohydrochlorin ferrochelatase [ANME-2 cluster archaeon]|nr:bifunctional precorrin-2 dehydrogenase/sirohydrochlorin ferrochelatase [ANME-2 cluster archaeon]